MSVSVTLLLLTFNIPFTSQVATVLLCCAFVYDIFWVFISPVIFHESVMIAVCFKIITFIYLSFNLENFFCAKLKTVPYINTVKMSHYVTKKEGGMG